MFFRFSHRDAQGKVISNAEQVLEVDKVFARIRDQIKDHEVQEEDCGHLLESSSTYLKFFDVIETNIRYNH